MESLYATIAHHIGSAHRCIAIVGSGGKTSLMVGLGAYYASVGESVLLSTTTKVQSPAAVLYGCDHYYDDDTILASRPQRHERTFYALKGGQKALAPPMNQLHTLSSRFSVSLIEADGARGKDLKIHSARDPVIPPFATATVALLSLASLGKRASEVCFGCGDDTAIVDIPYLEAYINHPAGPLKGVAGRYVLLCNQSEGVEQSSIDHLRHACSHLPIIFGSVKHNTVYH